MQGPSALFSWLSAVELAEVVRRLDDALVARRADVELLVLVFGLEGVGLDRVRRGHPAVRAEVFTQGGQVGARRDQPKNLRGRLIALLDVVGHAILHRIGGGCS